MNELAIPLPSRAPSPIFLAAVLSATLFHAVDARASSDEQKGAELFTERCTACHSLNPTRKPGPILSGVYGRRAGTAPNYHYSAALQGASVTWNDQTLDRWLTNPPAFIPGVNMQAQVADPKDRHDLISYLKSISPRVRRLVGGRSEPD
ncbi:MAG TPA: c-type cytochrome [Caulobacteraceae bacterium]|jgi:cytochrome c